MQAWNGADHWLAAIQSRLAAPAGELQRRRVKIARDTLLTIARHDAAAADTATGRGVATAHETVALALGMCKRTVQRGRELLEALGFAQTVVAGRYLTTAERADARRRHGADQRRAASVRALTLPVKVCAVENVHLPPKGLSPSTSHVYENSPTRADAHERAASRPKQRMHGHSPRRSTRRHPSAYAPAIQRMAAELVTLPFLTPWRGSRTLGAGAAAPDTRHIGAICRVIAMSPLNVDRFTAADVFDVLEQISRTSELRVVDAAQIRSPLGYLATLLRRVAAYTAAYDWPSRAERAAQVDVERERARASRQAELDGERIRLEQLHSPEAQAQVDAVLEQMRRDFPRPEHRRTMRSS